MVKNLKQENIVDNSSSISGIVNEIFFSCELWIIYFYWIQCYWCSSIPGKLALKSIKNNLLVSFMELNLLLSKDKYIKVNELKLFTQIESNSNIVYFVFIFKNSDFLVG